MTGRENWVQNMLNDQKDKLCNDPEVSNRTNQLQTQIMIERCNPLLELTRDPRKMEEKRPVRRRSTRSFHEEAVKTDRTVQLLVETGRTQTRSSDDSKSLNVEMAHDKTGQPFVETHRKCARSSPNTFLSLKHKLQRWSRNNS